MNKIETVTMFSVNLKKALKQRHLSLKEVSNLTGIPVTTLSEWCNGRVPRVSANLLKLSRVLKVTLEELVDGNAVGRTSAQHPLHELLNSGGENFIQIYSGDYRINVAKKKDGETKK